MKPERKYFIKLSILTAVIAYLFLVWRPGYFLEEISVGFLILFIIFAIIPLIGRPIYLIWKTYLNITNQAMRFFQGFGLLFGFIGLYAYVSSTDSLKIKYFSVFTFDVQQFIFWSSLAFIIISIGMINSIANPLFQLWMKLAHLIQAVMSRVILTLLYILAVLPVGLIAKIFGKNFLETRFEPESKTYWKEKKQTKTGIERYERPF